MRFEISPGLVLVEKEVVSFSVPGYRVIQSGVPEYKPGEIIVVQQGVVPQEIPEGHIYLPQYVYGRYREDGNNSETVS